VSEASLAAVPPDERKGLPFRRVFNYFGGSASEWGGGAAVLFETDGKAQPFRPSAGEARFGKRSNLKFEI